MKRTAKIITASDLPSSAEFEEELERVRYRRSFAFAMRSTIYTLITVAAVAVLVAVLVLPVLRIYGESMAPTLSEGQLVLSVKGGRFQPGDVVAFYYNNKILVKRVIARPGEWVNLNEAGDVFVNGVPLEEPYLQSKAFGTCDIELPFQVPEGMLFVMGDHRDVSVDSRSRIVGCVAEEQIVGKIFFRFWPLEDLGPLR